MNISILQEAPCHICADRNIHSPRNVGQINDLLHEGRHLDSVLLDSSGKSFIRSHSTGRTLASQAHSFVMDSCRGLRNSQSQAGIAIGQPWSSGVAVEGS